MNSIKTWCLRNLSLIYILGLKVRVIVVCQSFSYVFCVYSSAVVSHTMPCLRCLWQALPTHRRNSDAPDWGIYHPENNITIHHSFDLWPNNSTISIYKEVVLFYHKSQLTLLLYLNKTQHSFVHVLRSWNYDGHIWTAVRRQLGAVHKSSRLSVGIKARTVDTAAVTTVLWWSKLPVSLHFNINATRSLPCLQS